MVCSNGNQSEDRYDSQEQHKICLMRTLVESHDPSAKDLDDLTIRRFLRARELDIEKGSAMLLKYLKWRREFVPKGFISEAEIPNELEQNKVLMQGFDRKGCRIVVVLGRNHFQSKLPDGIDELKRLVVYSFDKVCSRLPVGEEKFVGIVDLEGWGYANSDIRGYLGALSILQVFFPYPLFVHAFHISLHSKSLRDWCNTIIQPNSPPILWLYSPVPSIIIFLTNFLGAKLVQFCFTDDLWPVRWDDPLEGCRLSIFKIWHHPFAAFFWQIVFVENKMLKATLLQEMEESQMQ